MPRARKRRLISLMALESATVGAVIRTISHTYNSHDPLPIMTGFTGGTCGITLEP